MEREPGDFERRDGDEARDAGGDAIDRLVASLPPCPGLPSTDGEIAAADAKARADIAAGRFVPHEDVVAWLKTWGTSGHMPMPREWLE